MTALIASRPHAATSRRSALAVAAAVCAVLVGVLPVQARERHGAMTGPMGGTTTRDVSRSHGDVSSSTTGPRGRTSSRTVDRSADGATAVLTGPKGSTVNRTTTRTETGSSTQITGSNGGSATVDVSRP